MNRRVIYIFLAIDFLLAQSYLIWDGCISSNPHFAVFSGDVGWWVKVLTYKFRIFNALVFASVVGARKMRLRIKDCLIIIVAYGYSILKDAWDWYANGNQHTKYVDWIVMIVLLMAIEFFYEVTVEVLKRWRRNQK